MLVKYILSEIYSSEHLQLRVDNIFAEFVYFVDKLKPNVYNYMYK